MTVLEHLQDVKFPDVSKKDIVAVKKLLIDYKRNNAMCVVLKQNGERLSVQQQEVYRNCSEAVRYIDMALHLILDDEVRRIIEFRFIKGHRHKETVMYFSTMDERTVDRKISEGIKVVAEALMSWSAPVL
ncbi:hypothetical protein DNH61_07745 [Paenibacillus sambharensis]|uniref:ArpU family transcriptional regulator n=1 Tax=Paenibacillus sambharensis TaxID=1803190 RepID=A0A2W1LNC7_9BACL|nr:hypothetical protein [Paenibacillus sambharensis]PZD96395.1 hypothetical protein DNH61_07745 [Paenibacillus sambharensis]